MLYTSDMGRGSQVQLANPLYGATPPRGDSAQERLLQHQAKLRLAEQAARAGDVDIFLDLLHQGEISDDEDSKELVRIALRQMTFHLMATYPENTPQEEISAQLAMTERLLAAGTEYGNRLINYAPLYTGLLNIYNTKNNYGGTGLNKLAARIDTLFNCAGLNHRRNYLVCRGPSGPKHLLAAQEEAGARTLCGSPRPDALETFAEYTDESLHESRALQPSSLSGQTVWWCEHCLKILNNLSPKQPMYHVFTQSSKAKAREITFLASWGQYVNMEVAQKIKIGQEENSAPLSAEEFKTFYEQAAWQGVALDLAQSIELASGQVLSTEIFDALKHFNGPPLAVKLPSCTI